jgi:hypothetical protein
MYEKGWKWDPATSSWSPNKAPVEVSHPIPEPHPVHEPAPANERKEDSPSSRLRVVIISFRARLCDPDNLFVKPLIDAIRYARLIPDDSPDHIELTLRQVKVYHYSDERTEIIVVAP